MSALPEDYTDLIARKMRPTAPVGFEPADLHECLFPFQRPVVAWACRQGRAALFEDCGLGKSVQQLEWARQVVDHTGGQVLIYAPLTVARQTIGEADRLGMTVTLARDAEDLDGPGVYVTNYDRFHRFTTVDLAGIILDESSILKSLDGKTRTALIDNYQDVPYRLCCTATPAPNDIAEIANHSEFLGIKTRTEMLATFFVHDDAGWRLKRHANTDFYRWLASWAVYLRKPSDLGFDDAGYDLPALVVREAIVPCEIVPDGHLFSAATSAGIVGRSEVRHATLDARVTKVVELINAEPNQQWILWCGLNAESDALAKMLPVGQVARVEGAHSEFQKEAALEDFIAGRARILITKPRVAGFGLNLQHCARQAFVGIGDSWEAYYQCLRRSWRFGQTREVHIWIVVSDVEQNILANVMRKEEEAKKMGDQILGNMGELERANLLEPIKQEVPSGHLDTVSGPGWTLHHGDCVEVLKKIEPGSVDLSVYSPPFATLYTYSDNPRDMGNSRSYVEFFEQFHHFTRALLAVTKPGRLTCVHVAQVPTTLQNNGEIGLFDFRGDCIRAYKHAGWVHHREVTIDKCPQAQAIRTHSKALLFTQKDKDRSWIGPALADFILVFRHPGQNAVPIRGDLDNETWIEWARPIWYGIRESDTLNVAEGRGQNDERHICPLQLGAIERCVRLWSNAGETVLSPFAGIGSEGYQSILSGRKFVGVELKPEYFRTATTNLKRAAHKVFQDSLFTA